MNRKVSNTINKILDDWIPPIIRDSKWFYVNFVLRAIAGKKRSYYADFKKKLPDMSENDINEYYTILADTFMERKTDLNDRCIEEILKDIKACETSGLSVLDAAAGRGFLANEIKNSGDYQVTALDIVVPKDQKPGINYVEGTLTQLPFADKSIDVVVCTHALEHIKDLDQAVAELHRVCRKKLIIVVPCQREYQYTPDLHINFFRYDFDLRMKLHLDSKCTIAKYNNDWYITRAM